MNSNMLLDAMVYAVSARDIMEKERQRQQYLFEHTKFLFSELTQEMKFQLLNILINELKLGADYYWGHLDCAVEPCPHCGSDDLFIKTRNLYRKYKKFDPHTLQAYTVTIPEGARLAFLCTNCKMTHVIFAASVTQGFRQWNEISMRIVAQKK